MKTHELNKKRWKKFLLLKQSIQNFHYWETSGLSSEEFMILEKWDIPPQMLMKKTVRENILEFFRNDDVKKITSLIQVESSKEHAKSQSDSDSTASQVKVSKYG